MRRSDRLQTNLSSGDRSLKKIGRSVLQVGKKMTEEERDQDHQEIQEIDAIEMTQEIEDIIKEVEEMIAITETEDHQVTVLMKKDTEEKEMIKRSQKAIRSIEEDLTVVKALIMGNLQPKRKKRSDN